MSQIKNAKPIATKKPAIARSAMACMLLSLVFGCGDADTPPVYIGPGTGGSTGSGGASVPQDATIADNKRTPTGRVRIRKFTAFP